MRYSKKQLAEKICEITQEHWGKNNSPILLSELGPTLSSCGYDYKAILDGEPIGHFIKNGVTGLKLIKHPKQFAKIGALPETAQYIFSDIEGQSVSENPEQSAAERLRKNRRAFYGFIAALSELAEEDIEGVTIPTKVIVKLLEGK